MARRKWIESMVRRDRRGRFTDKGRAAVANVRNRRAATRARNAAERRDAPLLYPNDKVRRYVRRNNSAAGIYAMIGGAGMSGYQLAALSRYPKGTPGKRIAQGLIAAQGASIVASGANTLYTTRKRTAPGHRASKRDLRGDRNRTLATTGAILGSYGATAAYNRAARSGVNIGGIATGARRYYKAKRGPLGVSRAAKARWRAGVRTQNRNARRAARGLGSTGGQFRRSGAARRSGVYRITTARRPSARVRAGASLRRVGARRAAARARRRPGTSLVRVR